MNVRATLVHAPHHQGGADVTLVAEEGAAQQHAGTDHGHLAVCVQLMHIQLGGGHQRHLLRIRCSAGAAAAKKEQRVWINPLAESWLFRYLQDVILQAMYLRAVLVGHDGTLCGTRIGAQYDAICIDDAHNGGASAHSLWRSVTFGQQFAISIKRERKGEKEREREKVAASHLLALMKLKPAGCPVTCGDPSPCIVAAAEEEKRKRKQKLGKCTKILKCCFSVCYARSCVSSWGCLTNKLIGIGSRHC